jgi:type VI secretion system protein ImpH
MASPARETTSDLIARMAAQPFAFDFFHAVRLLEASAPERPHLGETLSPADDLVRFGQNPSLAFPPSTLESVTAAREGRAAKLLVNFFGMFGPNGALPFHITEHARERQRNAHDPTLVAFLDVFHHRLLSLFYRAWAVNQKAVDFDRPDKSRFATYVGSTFGVGMESLRDRDAVPDWAKLYFSGRLASQTRNAEGLEAIISEFFGLPAKVQTFAGQWLTLPPASVCRLGASPESGTLGQTVIVGSRFWDVQMKFRVRLGPMGFLDLQRMLPVGDAFQRLKAWIRNYIGYELCWDAQLVLKKEEVPNAVLGRSGMLGWTTWLKSKPFPRDAEDVILQGEACV